jgi:hypothetical protein
VAIDLLIDALSRAHGGSSGGSPGSLDYLDPAWLAGGLIVLRDATKGLGYWARFGTGKLTPAQLRATLLKVIESGKVAVGTVAAKLAAGKVSVAGWARGMLGKLIPTYQAGAMALQDATDLDGPGRKDLAGLIRDQAKWLGRFRDGISSGDVATHDGGNGLPSAGFLNRCRSYCVSAWAVAFDVERRYQIRAGKRLERRVLGALKSCNVCIRESKKGWVKIGSLLMLGQSAPCGGNCRCVFEFR